MTAADPRILRPSAFRLGLLLVLAIFSQCPLPASAANYAELLREGDRLDEANLNAEALDIYLRAAQVRTPDAELLRRIAKQNSQLMSDAKSGSDKKALGRMAVDYARRAVEADPKNASARLSLAICYGRLAQVEGPGTRIEYSKRVLREAEIAARLDPRNDYAWHVLGRWHYEMANLNPALRAIAQTLYGKFPDASNEKAIEYLERAVRVGPPRVIHHIELGRAYLAAGRNAEARAQIERGLALPSREKDDEETKRRGREALSRT